MAEILLIRKDVCVGRLFCVQMLFERRRLAQNLRMSEAVQGGHDFPRRSMTRATDGFNVRPSIGCSYDSRASNPASTSLRIARTALLYNMTLTGYGLRTARVATQSLRTASLPKVQQRNLQDIAITRTGKPIIRISGGRSVYKLLPLYVGAVTNAIQRRSSLGGPIMVKRSRKSYHS